MRSFMHKSDDQDQNPEPREFDKALLREVEEQRCIRPYGMPVVNHDQSFKCKQKQGGQYAPAAVNKVARCRDQASQDSDPDPRPKS